MTEPRNNIAQSAVRGVLWTGTGQVMRQVLQVATSLVLVRLLVPDDFGVAGMAMFFVGIGQLLADFGIGAALTQSRTTDRAALSTCFWLNLVVSASFALGLVVASPLIGTFYKRPDLVPVVMGLSLSLLVSGLLPVPTSLLARELRFAALARSQVLGTAIGSVAAIVTAWLGYGVWALVVQPLVGSLGTATGFLLALDWRPRLEFSWAKIKDLVGFSAALLGTNLVGYINRNADTVIVGRFLGAGPLGIYAMAVQVMLYPLQQVSSVIVRVLFPTLTHLQEDLPRLRSAYLKAVGAIALVTFPMMAGIFAVAEDFVLVLFGKEWLPMTPVLRVLVWIGMIQSIGTTVGSLYLARGRPGLALRVTLVGAPVLIGGMFAGLPWGLFGVALGYAAANVVLFVYVCHTAYRLIALPMPDLWFTLSRTLVTSLVMIGVVLLAESLMGTLQPIARLSYSIAVGIVAYIATSMLINRAQMRDVWGVLQLMRRQSER
jgi:PST family polysaccharide transporter